MNKLKRVFVEKKVGFDVESQSLSHELFSTFHNNKYKSVRQINIYDIEYANESEVNYLVNNILSSKNTDIVFEKVSSKKGTAIAFEYLPGQYDQRADRAMQCAALINPKTDIKIKSGTLIIFENNLSNDETNEIKKFLINKIECREKNLDKIFFESSNVQKQIETIKNFIQSDEKQLMNIYSLLKLSMTFEDFKHIHNYFKNDEKRDPTETEIRMLDTYWSDHCRHTTFETEITKVSFDKDEINSEIRRDWNYYLSIKKEVSPNKPVTLMDIATSWPKYLRSKGKLDDVEFTSEVNACTLIRDVEINGHPVKYSIQFKNETHNHPTEIEPFGGASTCLGGAIRDPLSGRSYVYQGLRITGAGDITENPALTMKGKLSQRKISKTAARGFASYGNEIGMSTTLVREIFHEGYKAKRMEVGAVVGANPHDYIIRKEPISGDLIVLIGGRTGRDGIGGATGSSKVQNTETVNVASSEVQKGNAPEERKIQRLFRNPEFTRLVKKSNDFGAGGLSVAVGEIADSVEIFANKVPLKYQGMNAHEITLSESQERMAIVIDKKNLEKILELAKSENLEATHIADVTDTGRLIIKYDSEVIVNIKRSFIDTNGIRQKTKALISGNKVLKQTFSEDIETEFYRNLSDLNVASQKGMSEMFDFSIGNTTVIAPYGGKLQNSPIQCSVQKIPLRNGLTNTATMMTFGFNPYISSSSPYIGGMLSVLESISKIVAAGGDFTNIRLSFQEYFEKLGKDPIKWGKPLAALLGALRVQRCFEIAAIGGKDSMSGTFENISVPPTLISFALTTIEAYKVLTTDFKKVGNYIYVLQVEYSKNGMPDLEKAKEDYENFLDLAKKEIIVSAFALEHGGISGAVAKMAFGTEFGCVIKYEDCFNYSYGSIVFESNSILEGFECIGRVSEEFIINGKRLNKDVALNIWEKTFKELYSLEVENSTEIKNCKIGVTNKKTFLPTKKLQSPNVLIVIFPGTNCEYDLEKKFINEGAHSEQWVFKNMTSEDIVESTKTLAEKIAGSDIFVIPGGFSASDEPDGSGKFIATILSNKLVKSAIEKHLKEKKLILGICNGFQALVRSGLLPYGKIIETKEDSPILFRNAINRHVAKYVKTKVSSTNSPWLNRFTLDEVHQIPVSHGEGRLILNQSILNDLIKKDLIAFQYVDDRNHITMNGKYNPNGSTYAIEGLVSQDGLVLGKMCHSERYEQNICKNIYGNKDQNIFKNAIKYFRGEQ